MLNKYDYLSVLYYKSSAYTDYTVAAADFDRDSVSITLDTTEYIYLGFYKTISDVYFHLTTPNTNTGVISLQYWNGSAWTAATNLIDQTKGFTRSGFIKWDRPTDRDVVINTVTQKWYRIAIGTKTSAMVIKGINLTFCDDWDLKQENSDILADTFLVGTDTSHIKIYQAVTSQIIQKLRNKGYTITGQKILTKWDLLKIEEVKVAATYLALHKIFMNASDSTDNFKTRADYYLNLFNEYMGSLSIDTSDDGVEDTAEVKTARSITMVR